MKLVLHAYQISIDRVYPNNSFFKKLNNLLDDHSGRNSIPINKDYKLAYMRVVLSNERDYFYACLKTGSNENYEKVVIDTSKDNEQIPNPKKLQQIEPNEELYIFYSYRHEVLLLSSKGKTIFEKLLKHHFSDSKIVIKQIFRTFDDFLEGLKELKEVRFVGQPNNVFTQTTRYNEVIQDIMGLDDPDSVEFRVMFNRPFLGKDAVALRNLKSKFDQGIYTKLVVVGEDSESIEQKLNINNYQMKVEIETGEKDDTKDKATEILRVLREKYSV